MRLVKNVPVPGHGWWGPAYGRVDPPEVVAALITNPACWDEPPTEDGSGVGGPASPMVSTGTAGAGNDGEGVASPDPEPAPTPLDLDALDKPALLALAAERGKDVDGRWGEKRLRDTLREAD